MRHCVGADVGSGIYVEHETDFEIMELRSLTEKNINALYDLNAQLSESENQRHLFTAAREDYAEAFLSSHPSCYGLLAYQDSQAVGFYIYYFEFASYIASRVLHIEDIFLIDGFDTDDFKNTLLEHAVNKSQAEGCCRVEMRVLKEFSFSVGLIENIGFREVTKWSTHRLDL